MRDLVSSKCLAGSFSGLNIGKNNAPPHTGVQGHEGKRQDVKPATLAWELEVLLSLDVIF